MIYSSIVLEKPSAEEWLNCHSKNLARNFDKKLFKFFIIILFYFCFFGTSGLCVFIEKFYQQLFAQHWNLKPARGLDTNTQIDSTESTLREFNVPENKELIERLMSCGLTHQNAPVKIEKR